MEWRNLHHTTSSSSRDKKETDPLSKFYAHCGTSYVCDLPQHATFGLKSKGVVTSVRFQHAAPFFKSVAFERPTSSEVSAVSERESPDLQGLKNKAVLRPSQTFA